MFVAKQDLPDIDLNNRPMVEEESMIVNNRSYKIDGNDNVVAEDGKSVSKADALRVRANYAARDNRLGKVRLDNDANMYMVFDTRDGIMVIKKTPKGSVSEVTPKNKKYAEIIESGFQGGDNTITGNETVTPVNPTSPGAQPQSTGEVESKKALLNEYIKEDQAAIKKIEDQLSGNKEARTKLYEKLKSLPEKSNERKKVLEKIETLARKSPSTTEINQLKRDLEFRKERLEKAKKELAALEGAAPVQPTAQVFTTKVNQFTYTYNPSTGEVIHKAKSGDKVETNETQINKVLAAYAKANNFETRTFNKQDYVKVGDKILNVNTGSRVTQKEIVDLFAVQPTQQTGDARIREAESGEQGISEAEKASIKAAMDAMLPPPDAFESREEYDQAEAEVKASKEYKDLERQLTGEARPQAPAPVAQQPRVAQSSPKRSVIEDTKFTYKGLNGESVTVDTDFRLTEGQGAALESLIDFVVNPKSSQKFEDLSMTLEGPAGTGKTTVIGLVKKVVDELNLGFLKEPTFIYAAPTHAATVELTSATVKLGETIPAATIQSLGAMAVDRQNPSKGPQPTARKKLTERSGTVNIIVLDEASMLSKSDYQFLKEFSQDSAKRGKRNYRVIFMGDPQQIPEVDPSNPKIKKVSAAFTDSPKVTLTEVKRTSDNDILEVLEEMRANITGRVPVKEGASNISYRRKAAGLKDYITKIKEDGEGTVYIGYTNKSVSETNKFVRKSLGYEGGLKPGEVLTGYLGYQSKQVAATLTTPPGLANSVRYTVESVEINSDNGQYLVNIKSRSRKLAALAEAGVEGMPEDGRIATTFVPLSPSDSIALESEPTKEQYEENNEYIAYQFRKLYKAKQKALSDRRYWVDFYEQKRRTSRFFATVDLGDDYVYNPSTDKMEVFDSKKPAHRKAKPDFYIEKGIDYGYAVTIHKAQGSTIDNVFFDANTLPPKGSTIVDKQGNRITEEAHALAYVAVSRSAKTLTVLGDRADKFYVLGEDEAPVIGYEKPVSPTTPPQTQEPMDGPLGRMGFTKPKGLVPLAGTVEDFLKKLDPNEVKAFREMSQNGELKTICKL